jgi:hypothetical protein
MSAGKPKDRPPKQNLRTAGKVEVRTKVVHPPSKAKAKDGTNKRGIGKE